MTDQDSEGASLGEAELRRWFDTTGLRMARQPVQGDSGDWLVELADTNFSLSADIADVPGNGRVTLRIQKNRALTIGERIPKGLAIDLGGAKLAIDRVPIIEDLEVKGPGRVEVQHSGLIRPRFIDDAGNVTLELRGQSSVSLAAGSVSLVADTGTVHLGGDPSEGIRLRGLTFKQNVTGGELVDVDLFSVAYSSLPSLTQTSRLRPWWPARESGAADLRRVRDLASSLDVPASEEVDQDGQRARFWGEIADATRRQGVGGRTQALGLWVAAEMRRLASTFWGDRVLLQASRLLGHGSLVGRPLFVWVAVALLTAAGLGWLYGDSTGGGTSFMGLWLDTLLSPFSFLRSGSTQPDLDRIISDGPWHARLLAFLPRAIGAAAVVFAVVAVRRRSRFHAE